MRSPSSLKVHLKTGLGNEREEAFVSLVATLAIAHRHSLLLPVDAPGWPLLDACSRGCVISARPDVVSLCGSCGLWSDHR